MRTIALTAAMAALFGALAFTGAADARAWSDPAGRITIDVPAGWSVNQPSGSPAHVTYVIAGTANNECQFIAVANPATEAAAPATVHRQSVDPARFTPAVWASALGAFSDIFRGAAPVLGATSVDTTNFWPIHRADATGGAHPVHAAIQIRPGVDLFAACLTYAGAEPLDMYQQVIRSVGHPNDAAWRATIEAVGAAPAAAPAP